MSLRGDIFLVGEVEFTAELQYATVETDDYETGKAQLTQAILHVERGEFRTLGITEKSEVKDKETGFTWQVVMVDDHPANVANVQLHCVKA